MKINLRAYNKTLNKMFSVKTLCYPYVWDILIDPVYASPQTMINMAHGLEDNTELMRGTGIKSRNGKEIFEGDIVEWPGFDGNKYQVCYDRWGIPALAGITNCEGGDFKEFEMQYNAAPSKCVILGNIYENKELLK